jgi:hypothetical protein
VASARAEPVAASEAAIIAAKERVRADKNVSNGTIRGPGLVSGLGTGQFQGGDEGRYLIRSGTERKSRGCV